ncbi:MAG: hypothetical protein Q9226_005698 [Calogaya cf. arnoldii]
MLHHLRTVCLILCILALHGWRLSVVTAAVTRPYKHLRASRPHCWDDNERFSPLVFRDCVDVIQEITEDHDPTIPLKFSKDPDLHPDIELPKYWSDVESKCGVGIDFAPDLGGYDRTTLNDIQGAAMAVAVDCIIKHPLHLGGFVEVGWYKRLGVLIAKPRARPIKLNGTVEKSQEKDLVVRTRENDTESFGSE